MLPDVDPDDIRSQTAISRVERIAGDCALRFALLGQIRFAKDIIEILTSNGITLGNWILNGHLKFAWHESDQWPDGWPGDQEIPSEEDFQANRNRNWVGLPKDMAEDEGGLEACLGVQDDQHADATTGASAMYKGQRLVRALEISVTLHDVEPEAKNLNHDNHASKKTKGKDGGTVEPTRSGKAFKVSDLDLQSAEILNKIVARLRANQQIEYLGQAKRLWPFYVRGLLADAIGLSKEEMEIKGQVLVEAFEKRFSHGHAPSHLAGKSIKELLGIGNKNTLDYLKKEEADMGPVPKTLFKQPATDEEIEQLEERLETVLPDDYKEFLKITNGFGNEDDQGILNGYFPDPALHDTEAVDWIEEEYFQLPVDILELGRDYEELLEMENKQSQPGGDFDWDTAFPLFDRVLEVGTLDIDNLWLVHPQLVEKAKEQYHTMYRLANEKQKKVIKRAMESFAGSKEAFESMHWCFAKWSSGGSACMSFYSSFSSYLEHVVVESMEEK